MATELRKIYQLKVTLKDSEPPIWRRILVEDSVPLDKFHIILQIVMGWTNSHLHQFAVNGKLYGMMDPDAFFELDEMEDERKFRLRDLLKKEKDSLIYEYDFGDAWTHEVILEKIMPYDPDIGVPKCIEAERACPPEDVGGIWGYFDFLGAIKDPSHPEHKSYKEWIGGSFDPSEYDMDAVNKLLREYCS